jgi:lambda family phage portal protein
MKPTLTERIKNYFFPPPAKAAKRNYAGARISKANSGWTTYPQGANWLLRCDLATLRARARDMVKNSPHFRKFILMAKANIVGHKGIQLQCDAKIGRRPHTVVNSRVEKAFWEWSKRETCTLSGKLNWIQVQQLAVEMLVRDGEVLIEHVEADNPFGYAIKIWNPDWLDETHNEVPAGGNRIIMGVEVDRNDRPVAYWLTEPPSANVYGYNPTSGNRYRRRVPAEDMTHIFLSTEDETQVRGVTWFHAALLQGKSLHEYSGGVVNSARMAAMTGGFFKKSDPDETMFEGEENADGSEADLSVDFTELSFHELPDGYEFQQFDPKQPTQNHAEFMNSMLHTLGAAVGVPGFSLAGDMSQVNFSSARVGLNEERDCVWLSLQEFVSDSLCRPVYQRWLKAVWLTGYVEITADNYKQLREPTFRPRGWDYIDPQKDVQAAIDAISNNLMTYKDFFAKQGKDLEDWLDDKKAEIELFKERGIPYGTAEMMQPQQQPKQLPAAPDAPQDDAERGYTNGKYAN